MSEPASEQDRLLDEAIDLVIRLQNDPDNPVTVEMIQTWRSRDPRHEVAWSRVAAVHGASGRLLEEKRRIERRQSLGLTRRNLAIGALAIGGGTCLGYGVVPSLIVAARADYASGTGQTRNIALPDGSMAILGPDSAIRLHFSERGRRIDLLAGMGFFEVAPDRERPFSVSTGDCLATALGTAFDVSNDAGIISVSVAHGSVAVNGFGRVAGRQETLEAGQWLVFDPGAGGLDRGTRDTDQIAAWRDRLLIAERETVAALVARISRWVPGRVVLADPFIAGQKVSGVFDLGEPFAALEAVVHPTGARVRRMSSLLTVVSPL
ncbi:FecR family protein [Agrobacterium sp. ES01]|uniref:FecR family protein n=1 Tax=Agrobacterium sp. ES01 TaxID=3420714 RepID=UPI003D115F11